MKVICLCILQSERAPLVLTAIQSIIIAQNIVANILLMLGVGDFHISDCNIHRQITFMLLLVYTV